MPGVSPSRAVVCAAMVRQVRRYPDLSLDALDDSELGPLDAALAHRIYDTVLRRWLTIEHLVGRGLHKGWEGMLPAAQAGLLVGGAQILFFERVPMRAAVHESVEWVGRNGGRRAGSMVNAVLRRLCELVTAGAEAVAEAERQAREDALEDAALDEPEGIVLRPTVVSVGDDGRGGPVEERAFRERWTDQPDEVPLEDGRSLVLGEKVMPRDPLERLSVATSHPMELLRSWAKSMSLREVRQAALHGIARPPIILNTAQAHQPLPEGRARAHTAPGHHVFTGSHDELLELLKSRHDLWVQDPASSLAVGSVLDLKPKLIVDVCAGQGTKTRQLSEAFPDAQVVATDIDLPRLRVLERVFKGSARVRVVPFEKLREYAGRADLVMLDVPCSNSGVLARRVEAKYRFDDRRMDQLLGAQRQIIADAVRLLPTSGRGAILYSTCSLDARENGEQAAWAEKWHDFEVSREARRLPEGGPGEAPERYSDGSYAVLLRR